MCFKAAFFRKTGECRLVDEMGAVVLRKETVLRGFGASQIREDPGTNHAVIVAAAWGCASLMGAVYGGSAMVGVLCVLLCNRPSGDQPICDQVFGAAVR